jgi:hypothetical protein
MNQKYLDRVLPFFPDAIIHNVNEMIIEPKKNISFRLDNIFSMVEFDCKMIEYLSRASCKGMPLYWERYFRRGLNSYFRKNWSVVEMELIYTRLGGGVNRSLCMKFIRGGFDLSLLERA